MRTYYIFAALIFMTAYGVFYFGFRKGGEGRLYKINDKIAFELHSSNENFNGVAIRSYRQTKGLVRFICGACEVDPSGAVEMVNVKYGKGDYVYTDFPQHDQIPTDIVNVKTGEAISAVVPPDFKFGDDFSHLAEYKSRNLTTGEENKLTQNYVRANFKPLSTFTNRCLYAHVIFAVILFFLAFPKILLNLLDAFSSSNDPNDPANYHRGIGD